MSDVQCGNPRHPRGSWHPATPLPYPGPSGWLEAIRQWWRTRKYGGDERDTEKPGQRRPGFATYYALLYPTLVEIGKKYGYAVALHGSLARDLDVIAEGAPGHGLQAGLSLRTRHRLALAPSHLRAPLPRGQAGHEAAASESRPRERHDDRDRVQLAAPRQGGRHGDGGHPRAVGQGEVAAVVPPLARTPNSGADSSSSTGGPERPRRHTPIAKPGSKDPHEVAALPAPPGGAR